MTAEPSGPSAADLSALTAAKRQLRSAVRVRRESRSPDRRAADDEARFVWLADLLATRAPDTVAAYLSAGTEPDTLRLVSWLAARRVRVLLPLLTDGRGDRLDEPRWAPYAGPDALRPGPLGLLEPATPALPARQLPEAEVVVCPGLAGNLRGDRLGRGGGWYDRALAHAGQASPVYVLLNGDEVFDAIPVQPWDRRVDALVTPEAVIACEPPYGR